MTLRAVVDTSILASALTGNRSAAPRHIYQAILSGHVTLISSITTLQELEHVLNRPIVAKYHRLSVDEVARIIDLLAVASDWVAGFVLATASPDRSDNKFLAAAVEGKADYIVSADKKHLLSLGQYEGIPILTARKFVDQLDAAHRPPSIA